MKVTFNIILSFLIAPGFSTRRRICRSSVRKQFNISVNDSIDKINSF